MYKLLAERKIRQGNKITHGLVVVRKTRIPEQAMAWHMIYGDTMYIDLPRNLKKLNITKIYKYLKKENIPIDRIIEYLIAYGYINDTNTIDNMLNYVKLLNKLNKKNNERHIYNPVQWLEEILKKVKGRELKWK